MRTTAIQPRHGFVLLWTLALLALVAVVLTDLTRRSAGRATEAVFAQEDLQRKWAITSARQLLLPRAGEIFGAVEEPEANKPIRPPVATLEIQQQLGDWKLDIAISDEQAKLNLNALYPAVSKQRLAESIRKLIGERQDGLTVALRPDADPPAKLPTSRPAGNPLLNGPLHTRSGIRPFASFAQVYAEDGPLTLFGTPGRPSPAMQHLTCWGNGQLNFTRASAPAMESFLELLLTRSQARRIIEARNNAPAEDISQWASAGGLNPEQKAAIARWAARQSTCYSLRIHARNDSRNAYELAVLDGSGGVLPEPTAPPAATQPAVQRPATAPTPRPEAPDQPVVYRLIW